jgi:hypothetical protein
VSFTKEELELLLRRASHQPKRKVGIHFNQLYNESMNRVELLAKALGGIVMEDQGYRGIIYVTDKKEYVRYHSTQGVHVVMKTPKVWRTIRAMLTPAEVRPFLEECGLVPKLVPVVRPLEAIAQAVDGVVVETFHTGGGVVRAEHEGRNVYYRLSNITGLDIVEHIVSKWRAVKRLANRTEVFRALTEGRVAELFDNIASDKKEVTS